MIPNPEYVADDALYLQKDLRYVGFELWQVKSGSIFDNVLVTDDAEYARAFAEKTWGASRDAEKAMFDAAKKKQQEEAAEKRRLLLEERAKQNELRMERARAQLAKMEAEKNEAIKQGKA